MKRKKIRITLVAIIMIILGCLTLKPEKTTIKKIEKTVEIEKITEIESNTNEVELSPEMKEVLKNTVLSRLYTYPKLFHKRGLGVIN